MGSPAARDRTRIVLRPLASPLPLGFYAFGTGMLLTGAAAVGWLPPNDATVSLLLLTFVGPLEALAAIIALLARDTLSFTGLGLFAASWITSGVVGVAGSRGPDDAVALFNWMFAAAVLALAVVAVREKPSLSAILLVATPNSVLAGVAQWTNDPSYATYAGGFGIALAVIAVVGGTALLVEDLLGRPLSDLARRRGSETALAGGLDQQVAGVEDEAGVRRQL